MSDDADLHQVVLGFVKPDGMPRVGAILARFEQHCFRVQWLRTMQLDEAAAYTLYAEHTGRPFFAPLIEFTVSGLVTVFVLRDRSVTRVAQYELGGQERFRRILGPASSIAAPPGTLRREFGTGSGPTNAIHATVSTGLIEREAKILGVWEELKALAGA